MRDTSPKGCEKIFDELFSDWEPWNEKIYKISEFGAQNISEYLESIDNLRYAQKASPEIEKYFFRGESKTYSTFLQPSILRNNPILTPFQANSHITQLEIDEINKFKNGSHGNTFQKFLSAPRRLIAGPGPGKNQCFFAPGPGLCGTRPPETRPSRVFPGKNPRRAGPLRRPRKGKRRRSSGLLFPSFP